jgi:hypothetical protein
MRLNLGCGGNKFPGWLNVDKFATCEPDQVVDLEQFPWPWADNSVDEIIMWHVLEHLGAETAVYFGVIKELYRVCRDGASISIAVPHPRHDSFLSDPTHVRPILPESFMLLSQAANREWMAKGTANTPLGLYIGVDFVVESIGYQLAEPWKELHDTKKITPADLQHAIRTYNNVIKQIDFVIHPVKPAGRTGAAAATRAEPVL